MNGIHTLYVFQVWVILLYVLGWLLTILAVIGMSWDQYRMRDRVTRLERQATQKAPSGPKEAKYPRLMPKPAPEPPPYTGKHSA